MTPNYLLSLTLICAFHPYFASILKVSQIGTQTTKKNLIESQILNYT